MGTSRLRVLMISNQYPTGPKPVVGGGGAHVFYLCRALASTKQIDITLLTHGEDGESEEVPNLKITQLNLADYKSYPTQAKCMNLARDSGVKIIHGHHYTGGFLGKLMATQLSLPLVLTMHKPPRITKVRNDYHCSDPDHAQWRELARNPAISANIAYSDGYEYELKRMGAPNICKIFHGVPVEYIQRNADLQAWSDRYLHGMLPQGKKLVVCPMRAEKPGIESFILAASIIHRNFRDVVFLITADPRRGSPSKKQRAQRLMRMSRCFGLDSNVIRFAELPLKRMWALLRKADVVALPSIREGLSIALLEAMALEKPIVAFDAPGIEEAIIHNESGILCEAGKEVQFAEAILGLLRNPKQGELLASNAAVRVREYFHANRMASEYLALYEKLNTASRPYPSS